MRLTEAEYQSIRDRRRPAPPARPASNSAIRQSQAGMNKTERRFEMAWLQPMLHAGELITYGYELVTLKLGNGVRYTPDFWAITSDNRTAFYEVKGPHSRDDAKVKLKVAATRYLNYEFHLCVYERGEWTISKVLP